MSASAHVIPGVFVDARSPDADAALSILGETPGRITRMVYDLKELTLIGIANPVPFYLQRTEDGYRLRDSDELSSRVPPDCVGAYAAFLRSLAHAPIGERRSLDVTVVDWDDTRVNFHIESTPVEMAEDGSVRLIVTDLVVVA